MVRLAWKGLYDVAILCSGDNDLAPAVEEVIAEHGRAMEVAGWRSKQHRQRLNVPGRNVWCHWLTQDDYEAVRDDTDYATRL